MYKQCSVSRQVFPSELTPIPHGMTAAWTLCWCGWGTSAPACRSFLADNSPWPGSSLEATGAGLHSLPVAVALRRAGPWKLSSMTELLPLLIRRYSKSRTAFYWVWQCPLDITTLSATRQQWCSELILKALFSSEGMFDDLEWFLFSSLLFVSDDVLLVSISFSLKN